MFLKLATAAMIVAAVSLPTVNAQAREHHGHDVRHHYRHHYRGYSDRLERRCMLSHSSLNYEPCMNKP